MNRTKPAEFRITEMQDYNPLPVPSPAPQGCFLPIVYEDTHLLVLNKHSGTPSVPHSSDETNTAVNAAIAHLPELLELAQASRKPLEPGLLHRLDTSTSGLLAFAKTRPELERLLDLWKKRQVRKFYRCLVVSSDATLDLPRTLRNSIGHDAKSTKRMRMIRETNTPKTKKWEQRQIRGKPLPAVTHLRKTYGSLRIATDQAQHGQSPQNSWYLIDLEVEIETGVMHQIRCHLSSIGLPILGDPIYAKKAAAEHQLILKHLQLPERLWLHASKIEIPLSNGTTLSVECEVPESWQSVFWRK